MARGGGTGLLYLLGGSQLRHWVLCHSRIGPGASLGGLGAGCRCRRQNPPRMFPAAWPARAAELRPRSSCRWWFAMCRWRCPRSGKQGVPAGCDVPGVLIPAAGRLPVRRLASLRAEHRERWPGSSPLHKPWEGERGSPGTGRRGERCRAPYPSTVSCEKHGSRAKSHWASARLPRLGVGGAEHPCSLLRVEMLYLLDINLLDIYTA